MKKRIFVLLLLLSLSAFSELIIFIPTVQASPSYEVFTDWTEVDSGGYLTQSSARANCTNMPRNADAYLYGNYSSRPIDSDFDHFFDVYVVNITQSDTRRARCMIYIVSQENGTNWMLVNSLDTHISISIWNPNLADKFTLMMRADGTDSPEGNYKYSTGTTYYFRLKRTSTTVQLKTYSSASNRTNETNPLETLTLTGVTVYSYTILQVTTSLGSALVNGKYITAFIENLDLRLSFVTFYFNDGGQFRIDNATVSNGTLNDYATDSVIELCAVTLNSTYVFESFNWTGGSSTTNPYDFTITGNMTIWLYFGIAGGVPTPYVIARFNFNVSNPEPNDPIFFNGSYSNSSATITAYNWTFGDGNNASTAETTHSFSSTGTFSVNLTVTSAVGSDSFIQNITVEIDILPYIFARFIFSPSNPAINETINFDGTDSESSSAISSYFWNFDDGTNSTNSKPTHAYSANGTYTVSLKVTSAAGTNTFSHDITVGGTVSDTDRTLMLLWCLPFALVFALILVKRKRT